MFVKTCCPPWLEWQTSTLREPGLSHEPLHFTSNSTSAARKPPSDHITVQLSLRDHSSSLPIIHFTTWQCWFFYFFLTQSVAKVNNVWNKHKQCFPNSSEAQKTIRFSVQSHSSTLLPEFRELRPAEMIGSSFFSLSLLYSEHVGASYVKVVNGSLQWLDDSLSSIITISLKEQFISECHKEWVIRVEEGRRRICISWLNKMFPH